MGLREWIALRSAPVGAEFEPEGLLHCESARGSVTYRNYHRPGKRTSLEKRLAFWTRGWPSSTARWTAIAC